MAYDKLVDSSVLDAGLKSIADAIRVKGGTSDSLAFPTAMAEAIAAIEAGGGVELPELTNPGTTFDLAEGKQLIDGDGNVVVGTIKRNKGGISAEVVPQAGGGGYPVVQMRYEFTEKTIIDPDYGKIITLSAYYESFGDAEAADVAKGKTFTSAAGLLAVGTREETSGSGGGIDNLDATLDGTLTEVDSNVSKVIGYALRGITTITRVNLPNATSIGTYAFYGCTGITSINAPNVTSLGTYAFYQCKGITEINFPKATTVPSTIFYQCTNLAKVDFGAAKSIAGNAFAYCAKLQTLILRYTGGVVTLNSTTFSGVSYDEYVYVPSALLADYEANSNWQSYVPSAKFRAIEDYPDVCG